MQAQVRLARDAVEYASDERCHILEVANDGGDELSIARVRVAPGVTTAWHRLEGISERYLIISGQAQVELEGMPATAVGAGDVVRIPANVAQRIRNTGAQDLLFHAICVPRFQPQAYVALE